MQVIRLGTLSKNKIGRRRDERSHHYAAAYKPTRDGRCIPAAAAFIRATDAVLFIVRSQGTRLQRGKRPSRNFQIKMMATTTRGAQYSLPHRHPQMATLAAAAAAKASGIAGGCCRVSGVGSGRRRRAQDHPAPVPAISTSRARGAKGCRAAAASGASASGCAAERDAVLSLAAAQRRGVGHSKDDREAMEVWKCVQLLCWGGDNRQISFMHLPFPDADAFTTHDSFMGFLALYSSRDSNFVSSLTRRLRWTPWWRRRGVPGEEGVTAPAPPRTPRASPPSGASCGPPSRRPCSCWRRGRDLYIKHQSPLFGAQLRALVWDEFSWVVSGPHTSPLFSWDELGCGFSNTTAKVELKSGN